MHSLLLHKTLETQAPGWKMSQRTDLALYSYFDQKNTLQVPNNSDYVITRTGPFVNIDASSKIYTEFLKTEYNLPELEKNHDLFWLEYFSPNVAKSLHIGHIRNINTGIAIENLLKLNYTHLVTDSHLGDWGVQFGILIWAVKQIENLESFTISLNEELVNVSQSLRAEDPVEYYMRLYIWGNQQEANYPMFAEEVRKEFVLLTQNDPLNTALWREIITECQVSYTPLTTLLGMKKPDYVLGESHYELLLEPLKRFLDKAELWEKDGLARYIDFASLDCNALDPKIQKLLRGLIQKNEGSELGRGYLISSTGYSTYLFRDLAARIEWAFHYQACISMTITDSSQLHHFHQLIVYAAWLANQASFQKSYPERVVFLLSNHISHLGYGRVTLQTGKMSTRKGNFVTAQEIVMATMQEALTIIEQKNPEYSESQKTEIAKLITASALKWNDLKVAIHQDSVFNPATILSFEGNTGVYQLYTYARLKSILSKNKKPNTKSINSELLTEREKTILRKLYLTPYQVQEAVIALEPHRICNLVYSIANDLNSWYASCNVTQESDLERKATLLAFCARSSEILKTMNQLLGIEVAEQL